MREQRECLGVNAGERRASLENADAQADLTAISGKADTTGGEVSEAGPSRCAGVVATACTQGKRAQHGRPQGVVRDDQPDAREGQAGRRGEAERFMVPTKPGNAGGGKGPQFKTNATRSEGPGDRATYQLRRVFRNCRLRCTRKRRQKPAIASTPCTTRSAARTFWPMPMLSAAVVRQARPAHSTEAAAPRDAGEPLMAIVSIKSQHVTIYDAEGWILRAPVSSGTTGRETPAGVFSVVQKDKDHHSNLYDDAWMPN